MKLERSFVLHRYLLSLFGADALADLRRHLQDTEEGLAGDGHSHFFHVLAGREGRTLELDGLAEYDRRVVEYETRLGRARGGFAFKYFQYLAVLFSEILLDALTNEPETLRSGLNAFLARVRRDEPGAVRLPDFTPDDLGRIAFFMATGSGKTLILHVNFWQILHYLEHGRHPEALVRRPDDRREFGSVILITPNEGLSRQHLDEFRRSGVPASLLIDDRSPPGIFGPDVKVIEIHKLADQPSKEGVSVLLEELGAANLVFVDEGHKGAGSVAQTWKDRQKALSKDGFLVEYSATFAQAIGGASRKIRDAILEEYGKAILFDYSYRHFYDDGYGKDFDVLNLARAREDQAHQVLVGGLLTYYRQLSVFRENARALHPYNVEKPLWVFLGSSVNAVYTRSGRKRSDVATIVEFLRRFLEEPDWATSAIGKILAGESGFLDDDTKLDLFAEHVTHLRGERPAELYELICRNVFHGRGALEVWELKNADGELGLRVSAPEDAQIPYFGVINIGDPSAFKKHVAERLELEAVEDRFTPSLFAAIQDPGSRIHILIGSKKFIEGWSSWRVSTMGLLNMGKGEGPQVIQLFGRGVRLKGKGWSLKRSTHLPGEDAHPEGLRALETLYIFGWNADYIKAFRAMMEQEEIGREIEIPIRSLFEEWPELPVPRRDPEYRVESETWVLDASGPTVSLDVTPRVAAVAGGEVGSGRFVDAGPVDFSKPHVRGLLDVDRLYVDLVEYKHRSRYGNVFIPRDQILPILERSTLTMPRADARDPDLLQDAASRVLCTHLDRYVRRKEREAESRHVQPAPYPQVQESFAPYYSVRVTSNELLKEIQALLKDDEALFGQDGGRPLPRLHLSRHLFAPVLLHPKDHGYKDEITVRPAGLVESETRFLEHLRDFWQAHHEGEEYEDVEVHVVRNRPRVGIGLFRRSGFFPDFIVWVQRRSASGIAVRFVEPHGLGFQGLAGNADRFEALRDLERLSEAPPFQELGIRIGGWLLSDTKLDHIPDRNGRGWDQLERDFPLLHQDGEGRYVAKVLQPI